MRLIEYFAAFTLLGYMTPRQPDGEKSRKGVRCGGVSLGGLAAATWKWPWLSSTPHRELSAGTTDLNGESIRGHHLPVAAHRYPTICWGGTHSTARLACNLASPYKFHVTKNLVVFVQCNFLRSGFDTKRKSVSCQRLSHARSKVSNSDGAFKVAILSLQSVRIGRVIASGKETDFA